MNTSIAAVLFDYGGVIELSSVNLTNQIIETLGITKEEWDAVYYAHNHLSNVGNTERKEILLFVAQKLGASRQQLQTIAELADEENKGKWVNTELVALIRKLKTIGLKTAIISNFTTVLRDRIIAQGIADAFDILIISSEEGYQKPDPRLFQKAYTQLGVEPSETVFVDDSPSSLRTAPEIGYTPILYTDNTNLKNELSALLGISL